MSREWLVERRGATSPDLVVYPVDGLPVTLDDVNWVIARLRPDDGPVSTPIRPGPPTWEYTYVKAEDADVAYGGRALDPGWEPFAVVEHAGESWVHLRRRVNGG